MRMMEMSLDLGFFVEALLNSQHLFCTREHTTPAPMEFGMVYKVWDVGKCYPNGRFLDDLMSIKYKKRDKVTEMSGVVNTKVLRTHVEIEDVVEVTTSFPHHKRFYPTKELAFRLPCESTAWRRATHYI